MTCAALITAAGHGKRMGANVPKQYLYLGEVPILVRTVLAFRNHPMIKKIVLTVPPGEEDHCRNVVLAPFGLDEIAAIVSGGAVRQASVYNGLKNLTDCDIVVIHDGVRPLISSDVITGTIKAARDSGASVACIPVRDTVKKQNGPYFETIPRSNLWLAHTPQTFHTQLIIKAHEKALEDDFIGTDDAALVERMGHAVTVVEDSSENIKITTPKDLELASVLLLGRQCFNGSNINRTF